MSKQHTPGRLVEEELDQDDDFASVIRQVDGDPYPFHVAYCNCQADARRLVACWNACEGIDTEYLEGDESLPHYAGRLMAQCDELLAERDALQARTATEFVEHQRELSKALDQRDELLAALVKLEAAFTDADITSREYRRNARLALIAARAAIAKAEGGAA